jgi:hypothetical protein
MQLSDEEEKGNHQVRRYELYEKSVSFLNRSSKTIKGYKPSKTTFSQVLKKMIEDEIVNRSMKLKHPNYIDFSLTSDAKIMRNLNILGISEESMTFTMVYQKILFSIAFSMPMSKSKLDEVLSQAKLDGSILDLFARNINNLNGISIKDFRKYAGSYYGPDIIDRAFTFLEQMNIIRKTYFIMI